MRWRAFCLLYCLFLCNSSTPGDFGTWWSVSLQNEACWWKGCYMVLLLLPHIPAYNLSSTRGLPDTWLNCSSQFVRKLVTTFLKNALSPIDTYGTSFINGSLRFSIKHWMYIMHMTTRAGCAGKLAASSRSRACGVTAATVCHQGTTRTAAASKGCHVIKMTPHTPHSICSLISVVRHGANCIIVAAGRVHSQAKVHKAAGGSIIKCNSYVCHFEYTL